MSVVGFYSFTLSIYLKINLTLIFFFSTNDIKVSKMDKKYYFYCSSNNVCTTRMVIHGQPVEPAVCLSDLYDVFLLDIVRDSRQNLWTMIYRSQ